MVRGINGTTPQRFGGPRSQQTRTLAILLRARGFAAWIGRQGVVLATGRHLPIPALNFDGGERALPQAVGHLRRRGAIRQFQFIDSLAASGLPPHDPDRFRAPPRTGVLLLPGSRGGATLNALFLLECLPTDAANYLGLMPCTEAVDFATIRRTLTGGRLGRVAGAAELPGRMEPGCGGGDRAILVRDACPDLLRATSLALGMVGTANEQAVGHGLPLIVAPGAGDQGKACVRMKQRWNGPAALHLSRDAQGGRGTTLTTGHRKRLSSSRAAR